MNFPLPQSRFPNQNVRVRMVLEEIRETDNKTRHYKEKSRFPVTKCSWEPVFAVPGLIQTEPSRFFGYPLFQVEKKICFFLIFLKYILNSFLSVI